MRQSLSPRRRREPPPWWTPSTSRLPSPAPTDLVFRLTKIRCDLGFSAKSQILEAFPGVSELGMKIICQNFASSLQTAADIESGRSRIDSIGSFTSDGSQDALLPQQPQAGPSSKATTSPRRTQRENLPLLARSTSTGGRSAYEEIEDNNWPSKLSCLIPDLILDM